MHKAVFIFLAMFLSSCFDTSWTPEEREAFRAKCSQTYETENEIFYFRGFGDDEFDSVWVKAYRESLLLDSFQLHVPPSINQYDRERKIRSTAINRVLDIRNDYHILIPGQKPYVLANMKMIMWAQYTMSGEGWGCVMGDYTIDGVRYEHDAMPTFQKRTTE
ncbi:MAG: hypothetical protein RLZZ262_880 [Bacteroidota bacterium]|jgi:hypothetical protein